MAEMITAQILFMLMIGIYLLRLCNILMGATGAAWQNKYNKDVLTLGFVKQFGFIAGISILFIGAAVLPAGLFVIDVAGQALGLKEIVFVVMAAYGTVSIKDFVEKAIELQNLKIDDQVARVSPRPTEFIDADASYTVYNGPMEVPANDEVPYAYDPAERE